MGIQKLAWRRRALREPPRRAGSQAGVLAVAPTLLNFAHTAVGTAAGTAVNNVLDFWVRMQTPVRTPAQVDAGLAAYVEALWADGGALVDVNTAIAHQCLL